MTLDVEKTRRDTPGCGEVLHFNNAGSSLMPDPVLRATVEHLELEARIGGYEAAAREEEALELIYGATARMLGCGTDEIAVVENATRAWDMAFYSIPFEPGDRILTAQAEYASNFIAFLQVARRTGAVVEPVPNDEHGQVSISALRDMMDERVRLIAMTHVPTNGGLVNPAKKIGEVAREAGCLYLLDACQSAGQMPLDVAEIGCDMLSATGRKYLRGPRGTGFLYVRREVLERLEPPFLDLHAAEWTARDRFEIRPDARRFENWETNFAGKIGLGVAVEYALDIGLEAIRERVYDLADSLRVRLTDISGVVVRDLGEERCGIVTFTAQGKSPDEIKNALSGHAINVSVSPPASTRLDSEARNLNEMARASVHYFNTGDEVERFCVTLGEVLSSAVSA
ncbi:MAG: aminotransferase class V-fold PLP-dependent enzyme [Actinomycetota bacterium]|jgi:selenocysteine lyase/cysteine desulfurase|nr:aminotransferase class V-fold PLP-dependent enzyme [Rubrobacter sp.]MDQ3238725.1 aminotransferase class V-fold PLP-dependent enzyme [Actinomycetota bacterium]